MKLYRISQPMENVDYCTYDSAVVAAPDEETARNMSPSYYDDGSLVDWSSPPNGWADKPEDVSVQYIGEAAEGTQQSVIIASYNAG